MRKTWAFAGTSIAGALTLGGCGDMVDKEQMYAEFDSSCQSSFVTAGGPADLAEPYCECSTNKVRERDYGPMDMLDMEKMDEVANECVAELS